MEKISIIIPVYNVEEYLKRCIESILNQNSFSYSDDSIEVLLVNDGSPDNSQAIIDRYVAKYSFIKGFKKENGGLSDARNYGLDRATGSYVWFIDSDDWINEDSLFTLSEIIIKTKSDIISFSGVEYVDNNNRYNILPTVMEGTYSSDDYLLMVLNLESSSHICFRIFKRTMFDNVRFPIGVVYEDAITFPKLLCQSKKIVQINMGLYYYYLRDGSITGSAPKNVKGIIKNMDALSEFLLIEKKIDKELIDKYTFSLYLIIAVTLVKYTDSFTNVLDDLNLVILKLKIKTVVKDKIKSRPTDVLKLIILKFYPKLLFKTYKIIDN